ncbi:MAG: glutathione S-transferase [Phenylobacterium zucineum]|nr:MAG: glutathione S-transferase [Phenylobacterium zucineum]
MLKLYYHPATISLAVQIALEDAGATSESEFVDFRTNAQRAPDFLAINPKSRVPALVTDRGVLTETPAILEFIARTHPAANLAPLDDPFAMAQVNAFNIYLCGTVHVAIAHRYRGYRWADDPDAIKAMAAKSPEVVADCFRVIEDEYFKGPFVMGDAYTICDPYLYVLSGWLDRDGIDRTQFPKVDAHFNMMGARESVKKVRADWGG